MRAGGAAHGALVRSVADDGVAADRADAHGAGAQIGFGLLCGGIAGNLLDRLRFGHVIDFVDLHFGSYIYPTFNVADAGICVGVVLYLWHSLRQAKDGT